MILDFMPKNLPGGIHATTGLRLQFSEAPCLRLFTPLADTEFLKTKKESVVRGTISQAQVYDNQGWKTKRTVFRRNWGVSLFYSPEV